MTHDEIPKKEAEIVAKGHKRLSAPELETLVKGKSFSGFYRHPFQYVIRIEADGSLWGENNFGTEDNGRWSIDPATGGFTVSWKNYWDANTAYGYSVDGAIHLFDAQTGEWRTSMLNEIAEI